MKYKSVTIRPDLTGKKFNVHVYTVDGDREDYGENFNAMGRVRAPIRLRSNLYAKSSPD